MEEYFPKPYDESVQPVQDALDPDYLTTPMGGAMKQWSTLCRVKQLRFESALNTVLETAAIRRSIITDQAKNAN